MTETRTTSLRRLWFQIHKWIGIILAIVIIPLSLTGSLLVWDDALDHALHPARYKVSGPAALPASAYLAAAKAVLPADSTVSTMTMPRQGPVMVSALDTPHGPQVQGPPARTAVWLDPANARVIEVEPQASGLLRFAHSFHGAFMIPGFGRALVGWVGVAMSLSCLTGLWLWLPTVGRWTRGFRWRRQPALDANLHHLTGFWIAIPLFILSVTGVVIAFPSMIGPARAGGGGMGQMRGRPQPLASPLLDVDKALAAAGSAKGPATITWPTTRDPAWHVSTGGRGPRGRTMLIDDASGAATPDTTPPRTPNWSRRLHAGNAMPFVWQLIIFIGGIIPALLAVTGIIMWLRTRRWRGDVARRTAGRRAVAES